MSVFAIIENDKVTNIVEAETKELLQMLLPEAELLETTEATGIAYVDSDYDREAGKFVPPQPFDSWTFSKSTWSWSAPKAYPEVEGKFFIWDEESLDWIEPVVVEVTAE